MDAEARSVRQRRAVVRSDGKLYSSGREAARDTGADQNEITRACQGKLLTVAGYCWRYADTIVDETFVEAQRLYAETALARRNARKALRAAAMALNLKQVADRSAA